MTEVRTTASAIAASLVVELRRTARDRRTLVLVFLMPALIATIVVYAIGSAEDDGGPVAIGWVSATDDASADLFRGAVVEHPDLAGVVSWRRFDTEAAATEAVAAEDPGAAIVVDAPRTAGGAAELRLVADEDPIASGVAATIIDRFLVGHAVATMAAQAGVLAPSGGSPVAVAAPSGASLDAAVHWGPSLGVFFVLLAMGHAAHRQVEDRHRGVVGRLGSVPCGPAPIVVGRALAATTIGAASLLTMAGVTRLVFGRAWGPWPQLVVVALATALAVAGTGAVIAAWSTTPGRAQSLTALVAFALAIAGGGFSPLGSTSAPSGLAGWLPTSLSFDAFGTATTTARWGDLVLPVAALLAIGLVLATLGSLQTRRWVG